MSDMGLVRTNNEDNFQISRDLSVAPMRWINNEAVLLTPQGALLVVADGMGGMNAGEVASQIAIDTMKEVFSPQALAGVNLSSTEEINNYIFMAVTEADRRIKQTAAARPETHGMGTTIVIAWLIAGKLYVGWCGDSRAYLFNPRNGLQRITKDHSYVQTLVDAGKLTDEQAFDYPQSNIITRCLSDSDAVAVADVMAEPYQVADGDIILLCTDGLCGMIRDNEIEYILRNTPETDLGVVAKALIDGALGAGGADNVTVALLQVVNGGVKPTTRPRPLAPAAGSQPAAPQGAPAAPAASAAADNEATAIPAAAAPAPAQPAKKSGSMLMTIIIGIVIGIAIAVACYFIFGNKGGADDSDKDLDDTTTTVLEEVNPSDNPGETQQEGQTDNSQGDAGESSGNVINSIGSALSGISTSTGQGAQPAAGGSQSGQPAATSTDATNAVTPAKVDSIKVDTEEKAPVQKTVKIGKNGMSLQKFMIAKKIKQPDLIKWNPDKFDENGKLKADLKKETVTLIYFE